MTRKHFVFVFLLLAVTGWSGETWGTLRTIPISDKVRSALTGVQIAETSFSKKHNGRYTADLDELKMHAEDYKSRMFSKRSIETLKGFNPIITLCGDRKSYTITVILPSTCEFNAIFTLTEKQLTQTTQQITNEDAVQKCNRNKKTKENLRIILRIIRIILSLLTFAASLFIAWFIGLIISAVLSALFKAEHKATSIISKTILISFIANILSTIFFILTVFQIMESFTLLFFVNLTVAIYASRLYLLAEDLPVKSKVIISCSSAVGSGIAIYIFYVLFLTLPFFH